MTRTRPSECPRGITSLAACPRGTPLSPDVRLTGRSDAPEGAIDARAVTPARRPTARRKGPESTARFMLAVVTGTYDGKRALVLGVANRRSIAWAIAKRLADGGAELAFTFQGERIAKSVRELAGSVSSPLVTECDVRSDDDVARVFDEVGKTFDGGLDL